MNKRVKLCLALFLALTVLVQYSFSPQAMVAYGLDNNNEVTAASTEDKPEPTQAATTSAPEPTQATTAPKPASEPSTSSDSSGSSDSSASSDSSESTEPTESTESADDSNAASEDANTDTDTEDPTTVEEEAAVDEEEAEEEEEEGWENSFSGSCNGLTVHVSAPDGAFKEGTKMVLGAVSDAAATNIVSSVVSEETEVVDVVGVDISFKYKGKTIQPDESVKVSISGAHLEGDNPVLYHKHGGTIEQLGASNNGASFTTSTFSPFVFAVTAQAVGETWKVTFYDRDAQQYAVVDVPKGEAIGDQLPDPIAREDYNPYWVIGKIVQGEQGPEFKKTGSRIDKTFVPEGDTTVGPDYDLTTYTVTFYKEDKTTVVAERTVTADSNYCVNDIPAVPAKSGSVGKWVYSGGDFGNKVKITQNTDVWAAYSQNVFTVTFKVEDSVYQTDTYFSGDTLKLPSAPVVDGKEFKGWLAGETQYVGGEEVTSNLTLVADFDSLYTVSFIVEDDDGKPIESLSQYFTKTEDEAIGTMPQDPFIQGKVFDKWVDQDGYTVTKDTVVKGDIIAKAQFHAIDVYTVTASFYYYADNGEKIIFDTQVKDIDKIPYTLNPPASTQTQQEHVDGAPVYYPSETSITLTADKFDSDKKASVEVQYVKYTAKYDVNHMLKDLEGDGYSVIDTDTDLEGVWGSLANLPVNEYEYYNWEKSQEKPIIEHTGLDGEEKDVFNVYYTRKNVSLSYETNGGSYVAGETVPYGTTVALPSENPKRTGYTFAGWYADAALTKAVTGSVTVEGDTTLYAKWTGATVNYTIIYMKEKYNAGGNEWVYENSRTATATAGTTVYAANAPKMQRTPNGYELSSEMNGTATAGGQGADTAVEIAADGSSVVKVYYSLIRYTIVFNINRNNGEINMGGATYSGSNYRIQNVVIGQDVSSQWPAQSSEIYSTNRYFDGWTDGYHSWLQITKVSVIDYEYFEAANSSHVVTWTAQWSRTTADRSAEYWLQQADGSYVRDNSLNQFGLNTTSLGGRQISGYTLHNGAPRGYTGSGYGTDAQGHYRYIYRFYYDRARYQIDYYYGDTKLTTKSNIYYEANINTTEYDYTPARPSGVDSDYTWGGWYADAKFAQKYEFKKMPGNNLALYAKWNAPTYNVKFVDDDGTTELAESQTVEKYKMATKPENNPTKKGYKFEGWFASKDGDEYYDWSNQITNNTVIYAHWTAEPLSYTVHYVDAANEQTKLADDKTVTNLNFKEGDTITEQALTIAGYRPDQGTKDVTLVRGKTNEITFKYTLKGESVPYTVKYILDPEEHSGNIPVAEEKTGTTDKDELIELAAAVDYDALYAAQPTLKGEKFFPDSVEKTLVLGTGENVLTFYYSQYKSVKVTVNYVDMDGEVIHTQFTDTLKVGKTFTLNRAPISGWELDKAVAGESYNGDPAGTSYKITDEVASGNGLVFTLFYKKKLTITATSATKSYDKTALTMPTDLADQVTVEGLLEGHNLTSVQFDYSGTDTPASATPGRINVGTAKVTPKNATIDKVADPAKYYSIRYISGTLTVTPLNVSVRIEPDRWTGNIYDGTVKKAGFTNGSKVVFDTHEGTNNWYISISNTAYQNLYGDAVWAAVKNKATYDASAAGQHYYGIAKSDAGDYTYDIDVTLADLPQDENFSVSLYVRQGRLEIKKADLTIRAQSHEFTYTGEAQSWPKYDPEGLITGVDEIEAVVSGSITYPSDSPVPNKIESYEFTKGKASNYNVKTVDGELTMTGAGEEITITAASNEWTYDGKAHSDSNVTVTKGALLKGDKLEAKATGSVTNVSDTAEGNNSVAEGYKITRNGANVTSEYKVTTEPGTLTINAKDATLTADNKSKVYGEADPKLTASKSGFIGSDSVKYNLSREAGEAVGTYVITVSIPGAETVQSSAAEFSAMAESKTVAVGNYKIKLVNGTFTISAPTEEDITPTPTPTPDDNPGGGNAIARVIPAAAPIAPATIVDTPAPTTIDEPAPPKAVNAYWALINLLCAIATALLSLIMLIRYFGRKKEEDEQVGEEVDVQRKGLARIASLIPAIGGIIAFIVTEDMSLPMAMVDKWTVLMVVILAIQAGVGIVAKLRDNKDDEDEEAMA